MLNFNGVPSRLVLIRNVNFIIEQQRLQTKSVYDRKLTNTLSHELLTPLNCILNVSSNLQEEIDDKLAKYADNAPKKKLKKLKREKECFECVWSSGKILEFTIRSIINR